MIRRLLPAFIACSLVAFAACNGGGGGDKTPAVASPSAVATSGATVAPTAAATPSGAIRALNLSDSEDVQGLIASTGGALVQEDVLYADLTRDGVEDAVVPISSGGTQGYTAFVVLTPEGDTTTSLLREKPAGGRGFQLAIEGDALVMIEPVPGPDDPECCPSMLRRTTYAWNGAALAVEDVQTVPNPNGGIKTPAVSP